MLCQDSKSRKLCYGTGQLLCGRKENLSLPTSGPVFRNQFYVVLVLASLSLVEKDGAHWLTVAALNKIGYGKRVQILQVCHSLGLHTIDYSAYWIISPRLAINKAGDIPKANAISVSTGLVHYIVIVPNWGC